MTTPAICRTLFKVVAVEVTIFFTQENDYAEPCNRVSTKMCTVEVEEKLFFLNIVSQTIDI